MPKVESSNFRWGAKNEWMNEWMFISLKQKDIFMNEKKYESCINDENVDNSIHTYFNMCSYNFNVMLLMFTS